MATQPPSSKPGWDGALTVLKVANIKTTSDKYSPALEEEEESSHPYVECEVPRELFLHRDNLMPPLEIGFERRIFG